MLVITRKQGQSLLIGGVVVKVLRQSGGNVKLGITAHKSVPVLREELIKRKAG